MRQYSGAQETAPTLRRDSSSETGRVDSANISGTGRLLGMTPRAAYEQSLEQDGARAHRMIPYDDTFKIATFPTTAKGKALVQPGRGVRINHLDYWCEAMRDPSVERTSVPVRYDPFDVSIGYVYLKGGWRKCIIAYDELAGCSERELQIIAEEVRKRKRLLQGRTQVEVTQEQLAQFRRDNAATEVVLRQQRKDRETLAALRALDGQSSPTGSPQLASPPVSDQSAPPVDGTSSTKTERPSEDKLLIFRRIR